MFERDLVGFEFKERKVIKEEVSGGTMKRNLVKKHGIVVWFLSIGLSIKFEQV